MVETTSFLIATEAPNWGLRQEVRVVSARLSAVKCVENSVSQVLCDRDFELCDYIIPLVNMMFFCGYKGTKNLRDRQGKSANILV